MLLVRRSPRVHTHRAKSGFYAQGPLSILHVTPKNTYIVPICCRCFEPSPFLRCQTQETAFTMANPLFPRLIAFATAFLTLRLIFSQSSVQAAKVNENKSPYFDGEWAIPTLEPGFEAEYRRYLQHLEKEHPDFRSEYGMRPGARVKGWPSKGGIYILYPCLGFELEFLGLDRFHNIPRPPLSESNATAEEESHCDKSRFLLFGSYKYSQSLLLKRC